MCMCFDDVMVVRAIAFVVVERNIAFNIVVALTLV